MQAFEKIKESRIEIVRGFSVFLALFLIVILSIICAYDNGPDSKVVGKWRWYNAAYFVRVFTMIAVAYTSFRICNSSKDHEKASDRVAFSMHYSLFMLNIIALVFFDPVVTVLLPLSNLGPLGTYCQQTAIAFMIMTIIFVVIYGINEFVGKS